MSYGKGSGADSPNNNRSPYLERRPNDVPFQLKVLVVVPTVQFSGLAIVAIFMNIPGSLQPPPQGQCFLCPFGYPIYSLSGYYIPIPNPNGQYQYCASPIPYPPCAQREFVID